MTRAVYFDEFGSLVIPIEKLAQLGGVKTANDCGNSVCDALKALSVALNNSGQDVNVSIRKLNATQMQDKGPRYIYTVTAEVVEHIEL